MKVKGLAQDYLSLAALSRDKKHEKNELKTSKREREMLVGVSVSVCMIHPLTDVKLSIYSFRACRHMDVFYVRLGAFILVQLSED